MAVICGVSFAIGIAFFSLGAWPVTGFLGLDVLLVYYAFRANYASAREFEAIEITPCKLLITRVTAKGRQERFEFNPYWARVHLDEEPSGQTRISLVSHGRSLLFGRFLSDDDRRSLAGVLDDELLARRTPPAAI